MSVRTARGVAGSERVAVDAAEAHLAAGGDAVAATVAGFFSAAGAAPGVLFGAVSLIVAQVGGGVRAFDGRQRQPGLGVKRPRGVSEGDATPSAARVAAPGSIAALLVALRYGRDPKTSPVVGPGVAEAKRVGSLRRAELLARIQRLGVSALSETAVARPLIHHAGPSEGGALALADLSAVPELDHPAQRRGPLREVPWRWEPSPLDGSESEGREEAGDRQQGLCVVDARGGIAALCYDHVVAGLHVEELDVLLALDAVPVRRGKKRLPPGVRLPAPAPVEVEVDVDEVPLAGRVLLAHREPLEVRGFRRRG